MHDLCVVFDIDDTLYLEADYVCSGFEAVDAWAAQWLGFPDFAVHCIELFRAGCRGRIFDAVLRPCGRATPEVISALVELYRAHRPRIQMAPDAAAALAEIRVRWPIAALSDGPVVSQSRKCEALGLSSLGCPIILTDLLGAAFRKPDPTAFQHLEASVPARHFVYVADNPLKDFTAPSQLGWTTVRVRRSGGLHCSRGNELVTPDIELPDCSNLPAALSRLFPRQ